MFATSLRFWSKLVILLYFYFILHYFFCLFHFYWLLLNFALFFFTSSVYAFLSSPLLLWKLCWQSAIKFIWKKEIIRCVEKFSFGMDSSLSTGLKEVLRSTQKTCTYRLKSQSLIKHHKWFSRSCQNVFAVVTDMVVAEGSISRNTVTVLVNILLLASKVKTIKRYVFQN